MRLVFTGSVFRLIILSLVEFGVLKNVFEYFIGCLERLGNGKSFKYSRFVAGRIVFTGNLKPTAIKVLLRGCHENTRQSVPIILGLNS